MVSFVGGTAAVHVSGQTSITAAMPTGLSAGDLVFAFVMRRNAPASEPVGWSLIHASDVFECTLNSGATPLFQNLYVYQKSDVSPSDSGLDVTFSQESADRMGVAFAAAGAGAEVLDVSSVTLNQQFTTNQVAPPSLNALSDEELFIVLGSTILAFSTPEVITPPSGFTLFSGSPLEAGRIGGAYKIATSPFANTGVFTFGETVFNQFNGLCGITIRIGAAPPANSCFSSAPSMLTAPGLLLAINDFSAVVANLRSFYFMDLLGPFGRVRVPISSWQATLRADLSNYLQCVIPAAEEWADAISAAESFVILRAAVLPGGSTLEYAMAGAGLDNVDLAQGTANFTITISGYTPGVSFTYPNLTPKQLSNVRARYLSGGGSRFRCDIDWLLRPGQAIIYDGATFNVGFINYYCLSNDSYMDVGEGS